MNRREFLKLCGVLVLAPAVAKEPEKPGKWTFIHKWRDVGPDDPIDIWDGGCRWDLPFPREPEIAWLYNDGKGRSYNDHLVSAWD